MNFVAIIAGIIPNMFDTPGVIDGKAPSLKMNYHYMVRSNTFVFPDNISYTMKESLILSKGRSQDMKAVHAIKRVFDGEIIDYTKSSFQKPKKYIKKKK